MTLTLHGTAYSRTVRNLWMAGELGIPFAHDAVGFGPAGCRSAQYVATLNPNGHIPTLTDDGLVMWESLAINLYLARKFGGPLAPANLAEEGAALSWSFWAAAELEPHAVEVLRHTAAAGVLDHSAGKPPAESGALAAAREIDALKAPLAVLDAALVRGGGHLMGGRFTVADLNVACICTYLRFVPQVLADRPAVRAWYQAARARPAAQAAFALRGE